MITGKALKCILIITSVLMLMSCEKEKVQEFSYNFTNLGGAIGGPIGNGYPIDIDGSTLTIEADGLSHSAYKSDNQWVLDYFDWIWAYYLPEDQRLCITLKNNITGHSRKAVVTGSNSSGQRIKVKIYQDK